MNLESWRTRSVGAAVVVCAVGAVLALSGRDSVAAPSRANMPNLYLQYVENLSGVTVEVTSKDDSPVTIKHIVINKKYNQFGCDLREGQANLPMELNFSDAIDFHFGNLVACNTPIYVEVETDRGVVVFNPTPQ